MFCSLSVSAQNVDSYKIGLEIPVCKLDADDTILKRLAYTLCYSERHEQAYWVAYVLTKDETENKFERSNKFVSDPDLVSGSAANADYSGSGFDRGHLAPAADMGFSQTTMQESFYFSNMSPQAPQFNRGIWKELEEQVRDWSQKYDSVYVVSGPILTDGLKTIGKNNKISVPAYYYKVLMRYVSDYTFSAIGFILPNEGSDKPLQSFAVSVDDVERVSGVDFFPQLPDCAENVIEKDLCVDCWFGDAQPQIIEVSPDNNLGKDSNSKSEKKN